MLSAPDLKHCPAEGIPEIAFAGRSNSGKSSVLNRLTGSRKTARTSKTPGRTQTLNFFQVAGGGRLVDLPGYGFARASRSQQARWHRHIEDYLSGRESLVGVVLVMDSRHPFQPSDNRIVQWALASELPLLLLLNKADKLSRGARTSTLHLAQKNVAKLPGTHSGTHSGTHVILFSAQNGLGCDETIDLLRNWLRKAPRST